MAYTQYTFDLGEYTAYEIKFVGRNGAKGERRAKRDKATPEQVKRQNQWLKEKKIKYVIIANFNTGDSWTTLKYPRGTRPDADRMRKDWKNFTKELRKVYKKAGIVCKWIKRMEIGKFGGPHIHMLISHIDNIDLVIKEAWHKTIADLIVKGRNYVNIAPFDMDGAEDVAKYLAAEPEKKGLEGQYNLFGEEEQKTFSRVDTSRNLKRPEAEKKTYSHWTVARIWRDGLKPSKGNYIIPDSVKVGINKVTGYSYIYYMEKRLDSKSKAPGERIKTVWEDNFT